MMSVVNRRPSLLAIGSARREHACKHPNRLPRYVRFATSACHEALLLLPARGGRFPRHHQGACTQCFENDSSIASHPAAITVFCEGAGMCHGPDYR